MRLAAIDLGSNSIKLTVAVWDPRTRLSILRREKESVRLGHSLLKGKLEEETITRALTTLSTYKSIAKQSGVTKVLTVATAAVREAKNRQKLIDRIRETTGLRTEILSGMEEARLIGLAAVYEASQDGSKNQPQLNLDIGGGSTELSLFKGTDPVLLRSVKLGTVRLNDLFISSDPPKPKEIRAMREEIQTALEQPLREFGAKEWKAVTGTSGTVLALVQSVNAWLGLAGKDLEVLRHQDLVSYNENLQTLSLEMRRTLPGISIQRADVLIPGSLILEELMATFEIKEIRRCNWSLREGVLLDYLLENELRIDHTATLRAHLAPCLALGRRMNFEESHGNTVSKHAVSLFDQLLDLHRLGQRERVLLGAAALLHDIGYAINHEQHHRHSQYIILHSEITGLTDRERSIVANVSRYHRKAMPKASHEHFAALSVGDQDIVWKLGSILRLADALDRSHSSIVSKIQVVIRPGSLRLDLEAIREPSHELIAVARKKDMFESYFNVLVEAK